MKEPRRIKLTDNPSNKDVNRLPLPPLEQSIIYFGQDNDDAYIPVNNLEKKNEDNSQNDTQSI